MSHGSTAAVGIVFVIFYLSIEYRTKNLGPTTKHQFIGFCLAFKEFKAIHIFLKTKNKNLKSNDLLSPITVCLKLRFKINPYTLSN